MHHAVDGILLDSLTMLLMQVMSRGYSASGQILLHILLSSSACFHSFISQKACYWYLSLAGVSRYAALMFSLFILYLHAFFRFEHSKKKSKRKRGQTMSPQVKSSYMQVCFI